MPQRVIQVLASLRLTVVLLALAVVLVFIGTMAQREVDVYDVQLRYFRSLFVLWTLPGTGLKAPVFPGGYLVGALLLANLVCARVRRWRLAKPKLGLTFVHAGLALLLAGQLATDHFQVESVMRLTEGEARNYSEDQRKSELVIVDTSHAGYDEVVTVPESLLGPSKEIRHDSLPFALRVKEYWANSRPVAAQQGTGSPGAGQPNNMDALFKPAPPVTRGDYRNMPAVSVEFLRPSGAFGTLTVSTWIDESQSVDCEGKTYSVALRPVRYYKPFTIELRKFTQARYTGTDIPRHFSSRVRVRRPDTGEDREAIISMNRPLRYGGETFYQGGYDERDERVSILQVVRNPGWLTPYLSCGLVGAGLTMHFLGGLFSFLRRRAA